MVSSTDQAIEVFLNSDLQYLGLEDYLIYK